MRHLRALPDWRELGWAACGINLGPDFNAVYAVNALMGVVPVSDIDGVSLSPDIQGAAELREAAWG